MIKLVLYEGEGYTPNDMRRLLNGGGANPDEVNALATRVMQQLKELPLINTNLVSAPPSEDNEADPDGGEYDGSWGSLARKHPLHDGILVRRLVGSGVLQLGKVTLQVEILPKVSDREDAASNRAALKRMWGYAVDLNLRANEIQAFMDDAELPLHEWLILRFLDQLDRLLARGIRSQYQEQEGNLMTVRGRLSVRDNQRQNALAPYRFYCRYDEFSPNRPENRLIRSAIAKVQDRAQHPRTRRRAASLAEWLHEIPRSTDIARDFSLWRTDRLMTQYQEIRPTCEWILRERSPAPMAGAKALFGRFVRMNDVFERYVTRWMQERLALARPNEYTVYEQGRGPAATRTLCQDNGYWRGHAMRPDVRIHGPGNQCVAVLDAKWKRARTDNKIASREDLYQMYAYASHWLRNPEPGNAPERNRLIGLVYPTVRADEHSVRFCYEELQDRVQGWALRFRLPQWQQDNGNWREGFQFAQEVNDLPEWISPFKVARSCS
jgi:5-methylcytosine-specific restriction endonuclease McrBC regulatory subunit McrC